MACIGLKYCLNEVAPSCRVFVLAHAYCAENMWANWETFFPKNFPNLLANIFVSRAANLLRDNVFLFCPGLFRSNKGYQFLALLSTNHNELL